MAAVTFTVFTATYNRAPLLGRVFSSLSRQTFTDFQWIIVDDGSIDETRGLVQKWQESASFPILYFFQENRGKHVAINRGLEQAEGEFFLIVDSDDQLLPHALERFHAIWNALPLERKRSLAGVMGICLFPDGSISPKIFPRDEMDMSYHEYWYRYDMKGDKCYFLLTERLRMTAYPEIAGEKFMPEGVLFNRIDARFHCVNEPMLVHEYQPGGLSANPVALRYRNPLGARLYYGEAVPLACGLKHKLKLMANFIRFSFHGKVSLRASFGETRSRLLFCLAFPLGAALAGLDRIRLSAARLKTQSV
ncbi:MAG: glycosyltransferase family A protein [Methylococcaceae bacterium]|nr:glycosyltransferase family A protein [Methylococcaceae bacterium]